MAEVGPNKLPNARVIGELVSSVFSEVN